MFSLWTDFQKWRIRRNVLSARANAAYAGRLGENLATHHLRKLTGYRVIFRNWRHGKGEIDIVCQKNEQLIFVEVRTRRAEALVSGFESINADKRAILLETCQNYMRALQKPPHSYRFDVVEIRLDGNGSYRLNHFENVPLFDDRASKKRK